MGGVGKMITFDYGGVWVRQHDYIIISKKCFALLVWFSFFYTYFRFTEINFFMQFDFRASFEVKYSSIQSKMTGIILNIFRFFWGTGWVWPIDYVIFRVGLAL